MPVTRRSNHSHMTERILNLTLEVIYLLTGEKYAAVKMVSIEGLLHGMHPPVSEEWRGSQSPITAPACQISEDNDKKILEVTNKIIGLLTGEVPMRCQDVNYFSGEREYEEAAMMEDQPPLISPDGSRTSHTSERSPGPLYYQDSAPEEHSESLYVQDEEEIHLKVAIKEESDDELMITEDPQCKEEELTPEVGLGGYNLRETLARPPISPTCDVNDSNVTLKHSEKNIVNRNVRGADTSSDVLDPEGSSLTTPKVNPGFQRMARSPGPPDEMHNVVPDVHTRLFRPSRCSNSKSSAPKKTHNHTPDIHPELAGTSRSSNLSILKGSDSMYQNSGLLAECKPPDLPDLQALPQYSSPNVHPGLYNVDSSLGLCNPGESTPEKTDMFNPARRQELCIKASSNPSTSSVKSDPLAQNSAAEFLVTNQPLDPYNYKLLSPMRVSEGRDWNAPMAYDHHRTPTSDRPERSANQKTSSSHHPQKKQAAKKIFRCAECGICFPGSTDLLKHRYRCHTKEKPFPCGECGKCYTQKSHLVNHQRIHTGENIFPCMECGRRFTLRSQFIKHMRTHTGEKPFSCPECGRCFAQKSTLDNHQSVHTGHKPFSCIECGKSFVRKATLQKHLEIHTGASRRVKRP